MNKNLLIGLGVLVLLLAGLGFAFKHQIKTMLMPAAPALEVTTAPVSSPTPATSGAVMEKEVIVEVDYTSSGFSPKTVTIKKGTTIKFVNKFSASMWVVSNPHPTHTDLPGFDELNSGDTYTYTFTKVGTWGYHNHLQSGDRGTVVVTE